MDPEKATRRELIEALQPEFTCFEEVHLRPALFPRRVIRCDVLAIPVEFEFSGMTFAFEVKNPNDPADTSFWKRAIRQAADYVYATIDPRPGLERLVGRRVSSAFVYPYLLPTGINEGAVRSYFELASYFRVGRVSREPQGQRRLHMWMGNQIWRTDRGFTPMARGALTGKRQLGSGKIDLLAELDGIGRSETQYVDIDPEWIEVDTSR